MVDGVALRASLTGHQAREQGLETLRVGGLIRVLNLRQHRATAVGRSTLAEAKDRLTDALKNLKQFAEQAEQERRRIAGDVRRRRRPRGPLGPRARRARTHRRRAATTRPTPGHTELTGLSLVTAAAAKPLSRVIGPLQLRPSHRRRRPRTARDDRQRAQPPRLAGPGLRKVTERLGGASGSEGTPSGTHSPPQKTAATALVSSPPPVRGDDLGCTCGRSPRRRAASGDSCESACADAARPPAT